MKNLNMYLKSLTRDKIKYFDILMGELVNSKLLECKERFMCYLLVLFFISLLIGTINVFVIMFIIIFTAIVIFYTTFSFCKFIDYRNSKNEIMKLPIDKILPDCLMYEYEKNNICNYTLDSYFDVNKVKIADIKSHLNIEQVSRFYVYIEEEAKKYTSSLVANEHINYILLVGFIEVYINARLLEEEQKMYDMILTIK